MNRRRTRIDPDTRRRQLLEAAIEVFRDTPYTDVSLQDLADAAGVTRGLIHHYLGSKRDVYIEVIREITHLPPSVPLVPKGAPQTFPEVVDPCVSLWLDMISSFGGLWIDAGSMMEVGDAEISAILREARAALVDRMIDEVPFPAGIDKGLLAAVLNAYAEFARSISVQWLTEQRITRDHAHSFLAETLRQLPTHVVPLAERTSEPSFGTRSVAGTA
ncbi:MAG: TetR/AcrR family transcriptional regulator [Actinobacteria bacterium]|nr:TetR/AcrR family transcriptional regulator [Actinomycetota bacterium]MCB9390588.1 TetR/AcrR family transcriptional regulator [Acidimicrobiia bacterium]